MNTGLIVTNLKILFVFVVILIHGYFLKIYKIRWKFVYQLVEKPGLKWPAWRLYFARKNVIHNNINCSTASRSNWINVKQTSYQRNWNTHTWASERGDLATPRFWNLTFSCHHFCEKCCFLSFVRKKWNFITSYPFLPTYGNIYCWLPLGKNPSDAHAHKAYTFTCDVVETVTFKTETETWFTSGAGCLETRPTANRWPMVYSWIGARYSRTSLQIPNVELRVACFLL